MAFIANQFTKIMTLTTKKKHFSTYPKRPILIHLQLVSTLKCLMYSLYLGKDLATESEAQPLYIYFFLVTSLPLALLKLSSIT